MNKVTEVTQEAYAVMIKGLWWTGVSNAQGPQLTVYLAEAWMGSDVSDITGLVARMNGRVVVIKAHPEL